MADARSPDDLSERLKKAAGAAFGRGDLTAGEKLLRRTAMIRPDDAVAWNNLGAVGRRLGALEPAARSFLRALQANPGSGNALAALLLVQAQRGERTISGRQPDLGALLARHPGVPEIWQALALLSKTTGDDRSAGEEMRRSLILAPANASGWLQLGQFQHAARRRIAIGCYARAIVAGPRSDGDAYAARLNLGGALHAEGDLPGAARIYRAALALRPGDAAARANLAALLVDLGEAGAAEAELRRVLAGEPGNRDGLWLSSCLRIGAGDAAGGYRAHHVRWTEPEPGSRAERFAGIPLWLGEAPEGKRICVWGDFGIGDEILFAPLACRLAAAGAKVVLEVDARLAGLAGRSFPELSVLPRSSSPCERPVGAFDFHVPSALLAKVFPHCQGGRRWIADPDRAPALKQALVTLGKGPTIGFAWGGGGSRTAWSKATDLADWAPLLGLPGFSFVSLQYNARPSPDWPDSLHPSPVDDLRDDIEGLAALIAALDGVVSISGINAHMTGAVGVPGWVLLPRLPLWFWGRSGTATAWYPSLRLYRREGDWREPIAAIAEAVRTRFSR